MNRCPKDWVTSHPCWGSTDPLVSRYLVIKYKFNLIFDGLYSYIYIFYVLIHDSMNMYAGPTTFARRCHYLSTDPGPTHPPPPLQFPMFLPSPLWPHYTIHPHSPIPPPHSRPHPPPPLFPIPRWPIQFYIHLGFITIHHNFSHSGPCPLSLFPLFF